MRILFPVVALLMTQPLQAATQSDHLHFYSTFDSHTFSESTSIESLLHDFRGDIRSGDHAFTFNRAEAGIQYDWLRVGYAQRYDYFLKFSEDVARLYHASVHDETLPPGKINQIALEANHVRAQGPTFGIEVQPLHNLQVALKISSFNADRMVDGKASGQVALLEEDEYSGAVHFLLNSSEDLLLEMPVPDPQGKGYAADVRLDWQITPAWQATLEVLDAYSRIDWEGVLYSDLTANTATVHFDQNGRLHTTPVLSGYQYLIDTEQTLPVKYRGQVQYQFSGQHAVFVEEWYVPEYVNQTTLGYLYLLAEGSHMGGYWNTATRAVGVMAEWRWLSLRAGTDNLDGREARAWDLALGVRVPLGW